MAAVLPAAFLVAVSMIERRAPASDRRQGRLLRRAVRAGTAVPAAGDEAQDGGDKALLAAAWRAPAEHQDQHGQPIIRDALRARLGVSNQAASELLRQFRAGESLLPAGSPL